MLQRIGRYEILERIAAGGQGTVYRARDTVLDRVVAVKVINQPVTDDPQYLEALQREARLASSLDHPNVTTVYDFQVEGDTAYITMEYVPDSLDKHVRAGQPLPYQRAVEIAVQICRGLAHAHENGVVHRDIKPQNILVTEDGTAKVTDFGIARALVSSTQSRGTRTMGTPWYMALEQWSGSRVDGRADLYSLGILLYEMLTGSVPFQGEAIEAIYVQHREAPVPPIPGHLDVPRAVEDMVRRALEKNPEDRFANASAMAGALEGSVTGAVSRESHPAQPPPLETPASPPPRPPEPPSVGAGTGGGRTGGFPRWLLFGGLGAAGTAAIAIVAIFAIGGNGDNGGGVQAVVSVPTATRMPTYTPYPAATPRPNSTSVAIPTPSPTYTLQPIPTARVIVFTPIPTPTPVPPILTPTAILEATYVLQWGTKGSGDGRLNSPEGVAVDESGNVYVADTNNNRIQKFSSSGRFLAKWGTEGSGDGQLKIPQGVAVDGSGNVYVADWGNDRIQKFSSSGVSLAKWGADGSGDGQFGYPGGVAVDGSGNVYVADTKNHRIQKFALVELTYYTKTNSEVQHRS